ncbi:hypothetical protein M3147_09995 [Agromyces mediolanus]|uniref:flavodoxin family protein n=1 Tax=Agromyces mediolanus TaxID=41986 RepID=UPI00203DE2BF|nr:flavodoxin domain-containing protein [Agromyces mediolanus]MCM3657582.1 hypothetical protein [Agromyces mediolanus]
MRTLVVYESMFGNTAAVAAAIARALGSTDAVRLELADDRPAIGDAELVIVGSPTHGFALPSRLSRRAARAQGADASATARAGVREWLGGLAAVRADSAPFAATFDVRQAPGAVGAPSHRVRRRLDGLGFRTIGEPASFRVGPTAGPLLDGELDRAAAWAEGLRGLAR